MRIVYGNLGHFGRTSIENNEVLNLNRKGTKYLLNDENLGAEGLVVNFSQIGAPDLLFQLTTCTVATMFELQQ